MINTESGAIESLGQQFLYSDNYSKLIWSPNSRYVVANWIPKETSGDSQIQLIDIQTKEIKQVTFDMGAKEVFDYR